MSRLRESPLGPLLFCLAIHIPSLQLCSDLCIMYLDDITLGGAVEVLLQDLNVISSLEEIGLSLNSRKSEVVCSDHAVYDRLLPSLPNCLYTDPSSAYLWHSRRKSTYCR